MNNINSIGERIKSIRKQYVLTQIDFAYSLEISQGTLSEVESGKAKPSFDVLVRLAEQYSVDMNWLIANHKGGLHSGLQDDELALLKNYRNLQSIAKEELLEYSNLRLQRFKKKNDY